MGDINHVTLLGTLVWPEVKDIGSLKSFRFKVLTDVPEGIQVSMLLSAGEFAEKKFRGRTISEICEKGRDAKYGVLLHGAILAGRINAQDEYNLYGVDAKPSHLTLLDTSPATRINQVRLRGRVKFIDKEGKDWKIILGCSYFSRNPNNEDDPGEWKDRLVRVAVDSDMVDSINEEEDLIIIGSMEEKYGDTWHRHVRADTVIKTNDN